MFHTAGVPYAGYLAVEAETGRKHEFESGVLVGMVGGSHDHARITARLVRALGNALDGSPCDTFSSDLKVWAGAVDSAFYPDVTVICGPSVRADHDPHATTSPSLVAEVLSPSTRGRDASVKLVAYKAIPTVRHIVLVDSERVLVMVHSRTEDGRWLVTDHVSLDDAITLALHGPVAVSLRELYDGVEFLADAVDEG